MKPILYSPTETAFDTNGLGILSDAISAPVVQELNGLYELTVKYPVTGIHAESIADRCIIVTKPDPVTDPQPFRIYRINPVSKGTITVYARHLAYDTMGIPVAPFSAASAADALFRMKNNAAVACPFTFSTDKTTAATMNATIPKSLWKTLGGSEGSILDVYGGEYEFDCYNIHLHTRRGADRGVSIRYGKNLKTLEQDRNCSNVYTGIYPYWTNSDGDLIQLPEKIIEASGTYNFVRIATVDFSSDFQDPPTEEQLRARAEKYMKDNDIGVPDISWKVEFVQLEQTEEYKGKALLERVLLGDTVTVIFPQMRVNASARAVRIEYDSILERYKSVTLGKVKSNLADTIIQQKQEIEKKPNTSLVQHIATKLSESITGAKGGSVRLLDTDGDGLPDELYIADKPDPAQAVKVWRYNYEGWAASKNGYNGPFEFGATLNDGLLASFVTAANLVAGTIKSKDGKTFFLDLDNGVLRGKFSELTIAGKTAEEIAEETAASMKQEAIAEAKAELDAYASTVTADISNLQNQIDGSITTWFDSYVPTASNAPASKWTTTNLKNQHLGDLFYIVDNTTYGGQVYRWALTSSTYSWQLVEDTEVAKALATAAQAQDTADGKRRVFVATPAPPYDKGDLWTDGADLRVCQTARASGSYTASDWVLATEYINSETAGNVAQEKADAAKAEAIAAAREELNNYASTVTADIENLQNQIDGSITTWFDSYVPTASNAPASKWTTTNLKNQHLGDLFYIVDNTTYGGQVYRWALTSSTYSWQLVEDTEVAKALATAAQAKDTADGKRRVFVATPAPPYDKGDLWTDGTDLRVCQTARASGSYTASDWVMATAYIDSETASQLAQDKVDAQTQTDIFNKLTENGTIPGLFMLNNQLYINAAYMVTGILRSKDGESFFVDLDNGTVRIKGVQELSDALDDYKKEVAHQFATTAEGVELSVREKVTQSMTDADNNLQEQINAITTNYRFTADGQYIGRADAEVVLRLAAGIVEVLVAGSVTSTFDRTGMTAEQANIKTLHLGDYTWSLGSDGHLTLS